MKFTFNYQKGETLIEALGALSVISIILIAVATVVITSLGNAAYNKNQTLSTKFAQQGVEQVRQIRNNNYAAFQTYNGLYCLAKGQVTLGSAQSSCTTPNTDTFIRSVLIEQNACAANVARVTINVYFKDGKCSGGTYCHKQTHASCLSTVNPVQVP